MSLPRNSVPTEEPRTSKIKSISPHFKSKPKTNPSLKAIEISRVASKSPGAPQLCPLPPFSLHGLGTKDSLNKLKTEEALTQAASLASYSNKFVGLKKPKSLMVSVVGTLPCPSELPRVNSRTSLSGSIDGIAESMPEPLKFIPKTLSLSKQDEAVNNAGQPIISKLNSEPANENLGKKIPIKILPKDTLKKSGVHFPAHNNGAFQSLGSFLSPKTNPTPKTAEQVSPENSSPGTAGDQRKNFTDYINKIPEEWSCDEKRSIIPCMSPFAKSPGQRSAVAQESPLMKSVDSSPRLKAPVTKPLKNKIEAMDQSSHLLELVAPDEGFDLEILSIVENDHSCNSPSRTKNRQASKLFNFEDCSFITPLPIPCSRRSVDLRAGIRSREDLFDEPKLQKGVMSNYQQNKELAQQLSTQRVSSSNRKLTGKPLIVNFEAIKSTSKALKKKGSKESPNKRSSVERQKLKAGMALIEDL